MNAPSVDQMLLDACASHEPQPRLVQSLLLRGADVNATTPNGMTPLLLAALKKHTLVATVLLHARADPHKANHQGNTAMFFARQTDNVALQRQLLAFGSEEA